MAEATLAELSLEPLLEPSQPRSSAGGQLRGGRLGEPLASRYGGQLAIPLRTDRPTVVANFVSTLDGVASYATPEAAGGGEISGFFEPDRFVMGLLRALADAVLIGAGTLRAAESERWTPDYIHPPSRAAYGALRSELGLAAQPTTVVVSSSGRLDLDHPGLADPNVPVIVITSQAAAGGLARKAAPHISIEAGGSERVEPGAILRLLDGAGARVVLCEGGPRLLGQLLAAGLVDELFLTIAPQIAGRSNARPRLGVVEGTAFTVDQAPWAQLVDLRRAGEHLFTRYRFEGRPT